MNARGGERELPVEPSISCPRRTKRELPVESTISPLTLDRLELSFSQASLLFSFLLISMPTVAAGIDFDHIAREWRMKYTEDGDKASATAAMAVLSEHLATIKAVAGVTAVTRTVCGKRAPRGARCGSA